MIISRTPFRISFFGGGTDYPAWFRENGGAVLALAINKYCYISCRPLPPFFEHRYRIVYSKNELVKKISEIAHPSVRAVLKWKGCDEGLEIHHDGDLPARSGLGSSSSFTVGLLNTIEAMNGRVISKSDLASQAIFVEQQLIGEAVGSQDQISAAFGGFNRIEFRPDGGFDVAPIIMRPERRQDLLGHLMLVFTGLSRIADQVARAQIANFRNRAADLWAMRGMVDEALEILQTPERPLAEFGDLLHESWMRKARLSDKVSTPEVDRIYKAARKAGAIGGKLLGAGGGGFMLFFVPPEKQANVRAKLKNLVHVPFAIDDYGSKIVLYQPNGLT